MRTLKILDEIYMTLYSMGETLIEIAEWAAYKIKDVAQNLYVKWRDNRALKGGSVNWEIIKSAFPDSFFPTEMRKSKVEDFIIICHGGMSVLYYYTKYTKLSKYVPSLLSNQMD